MAVASQSTCRQSQLRRDCMVCAESAADKTCRIRVNLVPADYKRRGKMKSFHFPQPVAAMFLFYPAIGVVAFPSPRYRLRFKFADGVTVDVTAK